MGEIGQRRVFPKVILDHWGCTNKCFEPILSKFWSSLVPSAMFMQQVVPLAGTLEWSHVEYGRNGLKTLV